MLRIYYCIDYGEKFVRKLTQKNPIEIGSRYSTCAELLHFITKSKTIIVNQKCVIVEKHKIIVNQKCLSGDKLI
jgi:hypothetical protein